MIYVLGWLAVGVATLVVIFVITHLPGRKPSGGDAEPVPQSAKDLLDAFYDSRGSLAHRILSHLLLPLLAIFLVVAGWPYVIWMGISEELARRQKAAAGAFREFAVETAHLQERLSAEAIERREIVSDPLNAVPALPFGHLHSAWRNYLQGLPEGCELWSFSAEWITEQGKGEMRSGYVAVLNGVPGSYLMTNCRTLDRDAATAPIPSNEIKIKQFKI